MSIGPGTRFGPYEILAPAGAGGMGEVYRARDTRLGRDVAVKVLPAHLSGSPALRQRFEREARAASSLNHPNICTLYDIGQENGVDFLVMEYLEGETLAARIERGALPTDELLRCGVEIADALDKAHRQGLIHRDLKPGNVMLTRAGAKLLDFGLAKSTGAAPDVSGLSASPTRTSPLTAEGTIIGTFQYMAPEQLEGQEADARSDIFAFGAVLYEMATGRTAFSGKTQASLIGSIMKEEPRPIAAVQPMAPPALDRLVRSCLAKDPDERRQSMHDVLLELKWIREGGSQAGVPVAVSARRRGRERIAWTAALLLAVAATGLGVLYLRQALEVEPTVRSYVLPAENTHFHFTSGGGPVEISPDGTTLAFVATNVAGTDQLWIRRLDELTPRALPGTEGASYPFWSPDSRFLGFFHERKLKKIDIAGGPALRICEAPEGRGGAWGPDGTILFTPTWRESIHRVPASGGTPEKVTEVDGARHETTHRWPHFLPDGRHFLYLAGTHTGSASSETNAIYLGELGSTERRMIVNARSNVAYASGYLLYLVGTTLMARPFDADQQEFLGDPVPLAEGITYSPGWFRATFSASRTGILALQIGGGTGSLSKLVWVDRSGRETETLGEEADYYSPRISPNGDRIAFTMDDPGDIWVFETDRRVRRRFTFDPAPEEEPVWSPDGREIIFNSLFGAGTGDIFRKVTTGTGNPELLLGTEEYKISNDWSRDGKHILFMSLSPKTGLDLWTLTPGEGKPVPLFQTEFTEEDGRFSPDGRWVAYGSDESGGEEIYVQRFPPTGGKWQVSNAGGHHPHWRQDGREIIYLAPDGRLTSVPVEGTADGRFEIGIPEPLFEVRLKDAPGGQFDVSADGQRFLLNVPSQAVYAVPILLVQNWTADLAP